MDRVTGTPLPRPLPPEDRALAAAAVNSLHEGWHAPIPEEGLFDRMGWLLPLTAERLREAGHPHIPAGMAENATPLLGTLREGQSKGICHGDPVGGNMLMSDGGRVMLIDPVPHHDPMEAIAAHWAVRARDGEDAMLLLTRTWPKTDRARAEAWMALNALTLTAYLPHTGRRPPGPLLTLLSPLQAA